MPRFASVALMASMALGSVCVIGCDKKEASTETKTTSPDGSMTKTDSKDTKSSDGTVTHSTETKEKPADKPADK